MSVPRYVSPLRYPGGKARMAAFLGELVSAQVSEMDVEVWVEPFAGGAGAGLTLLSAGEVGEVWLTEKNPALAALWRAMLANAGDLAELIQATVPDMSLWEWARGVLADTSGARSDVELGFAALVVNRCSRSGMIRPGVGPIGGRDQGGSWTLGARWNAKALADRVQRVGAMAGRIRFTEGDAVAAIAGLAGSGIEDEVLLFVDPPYIRQGNRLYADGMDAEGHRCLAAALNSCPARWILTYDDEPMVADELYPDRRVLAYRIANTANRARIATEHAVISDNLALPDTLELLRGAQATWVRARAA